MEMSNENNKYLTKDLHEAAVLLTMKRSLLDIKREGRQCWFIFENKERCQQISKQYYFDTLLVNARDLVESQQILKNRIFSN
jgi:hypothetical protein